MIEIYSGESSHFGPANDAKKFVRKKDFCEVWSWKEQSWLLNEKILNFWGQDEVWSEPECWIVRSGRENAKNELIFKLLAVSDNSNFAILTA